MVCLAASLWGGKFGQERAMETSPITKIDEITVPTYSPFTVPQSWGHPRQAVLWIRIQIRRDPELLPGSGSGIIVSDPDPAKSERACK